MQNPSLTYLITDLYIDFSTSTTFLLLHYAAHGCLPVEWNSEEEGSLGRREEGRALWCLPFIGWWCLLLCRVYQLAGGASERASRARPRMREICSFCEMDNRRILKDPETSNTHPDASYLDKEDGWEFAYLLHVTCAHWSVGPHAWAPHVSDRPVGVKTRLIIIVH